MRAPGLLGLALLTMLEASALARAQGPATLSECDAMIRDHPSEPGSYRCYWFVARRLENWTGAIAHLRARLAQRPDDDRARLSLALLEADLGRNEEAFEDFRMSWEGFREKGDARGEVYARQGHAYVLIHQGGLQEADAILEAGAAVAERSGDDMLLAAMLVEQGVLAQRRGDFGWARNRFESARRRLDPSDSMFFFLRGRVLTGLGEAARSMGRHRDALGFFEERAAMLHEIGGHYQEMFSRYDIASTTDVLWRLGQADEATVRRLVEDTLRDSVRYENEWIEAGARILRARFVDAEAGRREIERATEILVELGQRELASRAFQHLARNAARRGDLEAGRREGGRALAFAEESGDPVEMALSRLTLAEIAWRTGPEEAARRAWARALDDVEAIRDLQPDDAVRARSFADWSFAYYRFASLVLDAYDRTGSRADLALALEVTERRRSRVLLEQLDAAHATADLYAPGPLADERHELLLRIAEVQRGLLGPDLANEERELAVRALEDLERQERVLRDAVARSNARFAALRAPSLPSLARVQQELGSDEALLSFNLPGMRDPWGELPASWLQISTRGRTWTVDLPSHEQIDPAVEMFLGLIQRRDASELLGARRLHDLLLREALASLPPEVKTLVIVPDGILHRLPFTALASAPRHGRLFERFETTIVPSVAAWLRWRERRPPAREAAALVLADPEPPSASRDARGAPDRGWALASGAALGALPHAETEGRWIVARLGRGRSVLRVGEEASERFLKRADLSRFPILHLAAHGVLDETTPERSAILLSPGDAAEDGLLQLRDIANLDLAGKLVVLSACKSASGEVLEGEGVLGLGRAFFQAGAQSVVGTRWMLGDREGAEAFEVFYDSLATGASVATALRHTQAELRARGAPASTWAGLVALGDGGFAPIERPRSSPWRPLVVLGLLALAGWRIAVPSRGGRE